MELDVDRLTLRLAGLSEGDARRVARLVMELLATADVPGARFTTDRLRLTVVPRPGDSLEATARLISTELLAALARAS